MWPKPGNSPVQLGTIALRGMLLYMFTSAGAVYLFKPGAAWAIGHYIGLGDWALRFCIAICLWFPGIVIMMSALSALKQGIRLERWSETEIDALRTEAERPLWIWVYCLFLAALVILPISQSHSATVSAWIFLWPPMTLIGSLRSAVRRPSALERKLINWSEVKALQSQHWGGQKSQ